MSRCSSLLANISLCVMYRALLSEAPPFQCIKATCLQSADCVFILAALLTAIPSQEQQQELTLAGVNDFLIKPISQKKLVETIEAYS